MNFLSKSLMSSLLFLFVAGMAHGGDLEPFAGQQGILKIAGGTAHIPVMKEAAELIMTGNPDIRITIAGGSDPGELQMGFGAAILLLAVCAVMFIGAFLIEQTISWRLRKY